jgi:ABC-type Fe3+-siderophore transport system permease subunit
MPESNNHLPDSDILGPSALAGIITFFVMLVLLFFAFKVEGFWSGVIAFIFGVAMGISRYIWKKSQVPPNRIKTP